MKISLLALFFILFSCATTPEQKPIKIHVTTIEERAQLVGRWYGEGYKFDGTTAHQRWVIDRKDNGEYTITYENSFPEQKKMVKTYKGFWGAMGNQYYTIARNEVVDGRLKPIPKDLEPFSNAYWIESLDKDNFVFSHVMSLERSVSKRVDAKFKFP